MSYHNIKSDKTHWNLVHAQAGRYAAGDAVFGSNLHFYTLNPDKGLAVPGDPTTDPVSGDGSTSADWIIQSFTTAGTSRQERIQILPSHIGPTDTITLSEVPESAAGVSAVIQGVSSMQNGIAFTVTGSLFSFSTYMKSVLNNAYWATLPIVDIYYHTSANYVGASIPLKGVYSTIHTYTPVTPQLILGHPIQNPISLGFNVDECDFLDIDLTESPSNQLGFTARGRVRDLEINVSFGTLAKFFDDSYYSWQFTTLANKQNGDGTLQSVARSQDSFIHEIRGIKIIR